MKRVLMFAIAAALLIAMTVPGYSWTGRMAGMGNPYGLVEDESDFLTHPTAITQGKGWQYYGDLGINYNKVSKWDYSGIFNSVSPRSFSASGSNWTTDASFGFTFPVNTGRMGVFLGYSGDFLSRGKYSGNGYQPEFINPYVDLDVKRRYDNIALRVLYGQPFTDKVKFGGEFAIAYTSEMNELARTSYYDDGTFSNASINYYNGADFSYLFPYKLPYDSKYWDTTLKASVEGLIGPSKLNVTILGGFILGGNGGSLTGYNKYDWNITSGSWSNHEGAVSGWKIGAEAWWRFPVARSVAIPVMVKALYSEKRRDGTGLRDSDGSIYITDYDSREKAFNVEAGAGVDANFGNKGRFAAGLYYGYTKNKDDFRYNEFLGSYASNYTYYSPYPEWKEHRLSLKLAGEFAVNPKVSLSGGFNFFYGWVDQAFGRNEGGWGLTSIDNDGYVWGIAAAFGAVVKLNSVTLEPYIKGGYSRLNLSGNGGGDSYGYYPILSTDYKKTQWNVGGGFAIKFN